ncbi:PucR family transcriptional regulator [Prauserella oleivorans]|uniref:Helix-turn-helix domain-containing protein n=2 Tax=Pseudonocardiaceae TaxID=2070 RepID=A0ABP7JTC2_9PSEU|nr:MULTISPECIES: helix-turn-helix domain-containing protein [Pseudonocardiaceae]MCF6427973.1 helix-turn-helix domain-containing protein [Amycolatopsis tucumanensis]
MDITTGDANLVTERVAAVGAALNRRLSSLTLEIRSRLASDIEPLRGDERLVQLLGASVEGNVDSALHVLQHGIDLDLVEAPPAATEYARRLAQHGVAVNALARAYRLGHDTFLRHGLQELDRQGGEASLLSAAARHLVALTFGYIDRVTEQVLAVYEDERERWLQDRNTVRAARIRELLDGERVDIAAAEAALGYRLVGSRHLAVVVWATGSVPPDGAMSTFERFARELAECLGCRALPLFLPHDQVTAWAWLQLGREAPDVDTIRSTMCPSHPGISVAVGEPGTDVWGFRRTHLQARQAQAVAVAAGESAPVVTAFREVGPIALMCADLRATRHWVQDTLGRLAFDDDQHARLRETLRVFLATGGSYQSAAAMLALHRNSVYYRVRKAEEELGRPIDADQLDIEIALKACHWLGTSVLTEQA